MSYVHVIFLYPIPDTVYTIYGLCVCVCVGGWAIDSVSEEHTEDRRKHTVSYTTLVHPKP